MNLKHLFLGKPRNPLKSDTRKHIALIAFLAWVGLGADGLSSSCYGPEQAFYALQQHRHLLFYLAFATALTVFLIAIAYNQVIKLFPNGGGGYKVASQLLGPYFGVISGAALMIDYVLTIAISIASGGDAIFSLLPVKFAYYKETVEVLVLLIMTFINLRGAKESIRILMPIFLGFFITHIAIIFIGIIFHERQIMPTLHATIKDTHNAIGTLGWVAVLGLFMRAYSLGAGTYTGIEAVSNNVNILAEPRTKTGAWTMAYMAISLSITAGGIIFLYLLWHVHPQADRTLNAVVFNEILSRFSWHHTGLYILLLFEAGILFVAANTGFLGGPAVVANMAMDHWVPRRFAALSSRLVTQNGILLFGITALLILLWTNGSVAFLVVLYSMNVFLTFAISILGVVKYYVQNRHSEHNWFWKVCYTSCAFIICVSILLITLVEKFDLGGWVTVISTGAVITGCILIRRHHNKVYLLKKKLNQELEVPLPKEDIKIRATNTEEPTAVFLVYEIGAAMHTLLWVQRLFPHHFKNFIFISYGVVDIGSFGSERALEKLKKDRGRVLDYLCRFSERQGVAAETFCNFGADPIEGITKLAAEVNSRFANTVYFASRYVYPNENWLTRIIHSNFVAVIQRRLQQLSVKMLVIPLNLDIENPN